MPIVENKSIARRFIHAWSAGGLGIVDELAAPDITVSYSHFPEPIRGAEKFKQVLIQTVNSFPDIRVTADELICEEDRVVVRWTYRGTHKSGNIFGIPAAGKQVSVSGITVYVIAHGKVVEENGLVDSFSLMRQLGAAPAPG
jgi:steroid delta-isomerase-like uncharacterized protein